MLPILAGLAAGAGSYFLGKKKKKDYEVPQPETLPPLTSYPTGQSINNIILNALNKGVGVGFPTDYVEKSTSPFVAEREAGWNLREKPALDASYAGRGLSRSTLAARDIGQAFAQKERDVNTIIADAYMKDLAQKKADQARYENLGLDFAQGESSIAGQNAGIINQNKMAQYAADQQYNQDKSNNINQAIGTALSFGSNLANLNQGNALLEILRQEQNTRNNSPFVTSNRWNTRWNSL